MTYVDLGELIPNTAADGILAQLYAIRGMYRGWLKRESVDPSDDPIFAAICSLMAVVDAGREPVTLESGV